MTSYLESEFMIQERRVILLNEYSTARSFRHCQYSVYSVQRETI